MSSRRKLIKGLTGAGIVGGSLPLLWSEPVVKSVILPAHAATTVPVLEEVRLLYISGILSNPEGDDCGSDARELVSITNGGNMAVDLTGYEIYRVLFLSGPELLVSLSGSIAVGETIDVDVCQGTTAGDSAVLNNGSGGLVAFTGPDGPIDLVSYPSQPNGPGEGTVFPYGPTPSPDLPPRTS